MFLRDRMLHGALSTNSPKIDSKYLHEKYVHTKDGYMDIQNCTSCRMMELSGYKHIENMRTTKVNRNKCPATNHECDRNLMLFRSFLCLPFSSLRCVVWCGGLVFFFVPLRFSRIKRITVQSNDPFSVCVFAVFFLFLFFHSAITCE